MYTFNFWFDFLCILLYQALYMYFTTFLDVVCQSHVYLPLIEKGLSQNKCYIYSHITCVKLFSITLSNKPWSIYEILTWSNSSIDSIMYYSCLIRLILPYLELTSNHKRRHAFYDRRIIKSRNNPVILISENE